MRVEEVSRIGHRVGHRGDVGAARARRAAVRAINRGIDQGLVALHVDHRRVVAPAGQLDHLGQAIGAAGVIGPRQQDPQTMPLGGGQHVRVVGGHQDLVGSGQQGALGDAHDHRLAAEVEQRLAGRRVDA
jgi:hypothetical protein